MGRKSVLGKGIGALLNNSIATPRNFDIEDEKDIAKPKSRKKEDKEEGLKSGSMLISVDSVIPNASQPRRFFKEDQLEELAESIKVNGIIQPIIVHYLDAKKKFEIIAGERRFRAAKMAGLNQVPVLVKKVTEKEKLAFAIIENVQRSDLNCVEEALAYFKLMDEYSLTQEEVAKRLGKSRSTVANFLRVLKLPKEVIVLLQKEALSFGHAKVLSGLNKINEQILFAQDAAKGSWSVKQLDSAIKNGLDEDKPKKSKQLTSKNSEFSLLEEKLERLSGYQFNIKANAKNKGKIEIKFSDLEEFNRIYKFLISK